MYVLTTAIGATSEKKEKKGRETPVTYKGQERKKNSTTSTERGGALGYTGNARDRVTCHVTAHFL